MRFNIKLTSFLASLIFLLGINKSLYATNNVEWANQQLQGMSALEEKADFSKAKIFAKQLKKSSALKNNSNVAWTQHELMKNHHIDTPNDQKLKTKNGINIDELINKYSNHMPSTERLMHGQFHDLLIFVSFSMPKQSLKLWLQQAKEAGGILVIRGLVDNSFKKTADAVQKLIGHTQGGIEVDPTLFRRFGIHKVPAVVVVNGEEPPCFNANGCPLIAPPYDVVYGNVTLQSALKEIENRGTVSQSKAGIILTHMRAMS